MLELLWKESQWTLREGIKSLMNPSCRTFMKNSRKQKEDQTEGKRSWKTQGETLQWLDGPSRWYIWESLELRKRKDETIETENLVNLRNKELNHLDETIIRITLCLSFTNSNWWQAMDFGILLILVERIKIDIVPTWESHRQVTGRIENNERISMTTKEEIFGRTPVRVKNEQRKDRETPGRISKWMKMLEGI